MNVALNSTAEPVPATPKAIVAACKQLESRVCDLSNLSDIVSVLFEVANPRQEDGAFCLSRREWERLAFAVYELSNRARDLHGAFYAALEGKEVAE